MRLSTHYKKLLKEAKKIPAVTKDEKRIARNKRKSTNVVSLIVNVKPVNRKKNKSERRKRANWQVQLSFPKIRRPHQKRPEYIGMVSNHKRVDYA